MRTIESQSLARVLRVTLLAVCFATPLASAGIGELAAKPTPGRPGPWDVCTFDYDFSQTPNEWWMGRIYAPVLDERDCRTRGPFNLVIIAHADFAIGNPAEAHLQYEELARHLASHSLMVVSLNRYRDQSPGGAIDYFDEVLLGHLAYLYGADSPVRGAITREMAILGHSSGGRSVTRYAALINANGWELRAIVVMAPTIDSDIDHDFSGVTEAVLGLHGTHDADANAFGAKFDGEPRSADVDSTRRSRRSDGRGL